MISEAFFFEEKQGENLKKEISINSHSFQLNKTKSFAQIYRELLLIDIEYFIFISQGKFQNSTLFPSNASKASLFFNVLTKVLSYSISKIC